MRAAAVLLAFATTAALLVAQVSNDECAQAISVGEGVHAGTTAGATTSAQAGPCAGTFFPSSVANDVWYVYTPGCSATALASLVPADGGSASYSWGTLAAFTGTCAGGLTKIACAGQIFLQPRITFPVSAGVPVYIEVGTTGTLGGAFNLAIQCFTPISNDECAGAITIGEGVVPGNTFQATTTTGLTFAGCMPGAPNYANDVWYRYVPSATGMALVSACPCDGGSASANVLLAAFTGDCGALSPIGCGYAGIFGSQARFFAPVTAGVPVRIMVAPTGVLAITFSLVVQSLPAVTNDECSGATPLMHGVTLSHNFGATASGIGGFCAPMYRDVWFQYTPASSGVATFSTCETDGGASAFYPQIIAFGGGCGALTPLSCNAAGPCSSYGTRVQVPVSAGIAIRIAIGSTWATQEGPFRLVVSFAPALPNDSCAGAIPLEMGVNGPFDNSAASDGGSPPTACIGPYWMFQNDVWFRWTSPVTGNVRIDTCGATFFAHVLVFDACGGNLVGCGFPDGSVCFPGGSFLTLSAVQGQTYRIRVAGLVSPSGQFHVHISGPYALSIDAPVPGKLQVQSHSGTPSFSFVTAVTVAAGAFPNGWFFGLDILMSEISAQIAMGFPFTGVLDAAGASPALVITGGVPSGLSLHAVSVTYDPATLDVRDVSAPVSFTTP
jgi:hypothetical protein